MKLIQQPIGIIEAESTSTISYKEFLDVSGKTLKEAKKIDKYNCESIAYMMLRDGWIKDHCPPIRYLGEGSSRLAMAIDGGKCLKIATNDEGIEQNANEISVLKAGKGYSCFP